MKNLALVCIIVVLALVLPCSATIYTVGDSSGWDISSDLNSWPSQKRFVVGDSLFFLYSSAHSVSEVTKKSNDGCNTMVAMKTYSDGNTTIPLTKGGDKYFVCGSKLHCLGGMKLQVHVEGNEANTPAGVPAGAPAGVPAGAPAGVPAGVLALSPESMPNPSSKSNYPATTIVPTSHGSTILHNGFASVLVSSLCLVSIIRQMV